MFRGPRQPLTHSLQRSNAIDVDGDGYSVTLMRAARGLSISFTNIGDFSVDVWAAARQAHQFELHDDTIDGQPNGQPYVLEAGAVVKFACNENTKWTTTQ